MSTVESVSVRAAAYRGTFGHIQGTSHTSVSTVESVLVSMITYRNTFGHIQGTSHTSVSTVESVSVRAVAYRDTFGCIQGTSHTSVSSHLQPQGLKYEFATVPCMHCHSDCLTGHHFIRSVQRFIRLYPALYYIFKPHKHSNNSFNGYHFFCSMLRRLHACWLSLL